MSTANSVIATPNDFEFDLPGIQSRGYGGYAVATALVHSGRFNIRGREYHSYGFCAMALQDLVARLAPTALVIPQYELDAFTVTHGDEISPEASIGTLPQPKTRGPVPDFVIVLVRAILHATGMPISPGIDLEFKYWGKIKIENVILGLVAEVKRRPTRSARSAYLFGTSLQVRIEAATKDARKQAKAAFIAHPDMKQLILVAFAGEWFCWKLAVRDDFDVKVKPRRQSVTEAETPGPQSGSQSNLDPAARRPAGTGDRAPPARASKLEATAAEGYYADKNPLPHALDIKIPYTPNSNPKPRRKKPKQRSKGKEKEVDPPRKPEIGKFRRYEPAELAGVTEIQHLMTPEEYNEPDLFRILWSHPILFGTQESKQNWFLIHRFLERINTRLNKPRGLQPCMTGGRGRFRRVCHRRVRCRLSICIRVGLEFGFGF
ncbi:hypothetical protein FPV67DRAFT_1532526 [Lyophyllum atratum]|nr:hypothetical protein FPV67DRAFT_1532526 [Lyophyllum atratum]